MTTSSSLHPEPESSCFSLLFLKRNLIQNPKSKIQNWLDSIKIKNAKMAKLICQLIPASCPFERNIKFLGHLLFRIPPLCHFNPFYNELMSLRFRALVFLSE